MSVLQKWMAGLIGLGAVWLVITNPQGFASALNAGQKFISGTEHTALTGKA